ncbi:hypothetical protein [Taklimakanibacter albus]|uniref:Uncharacterized protein n=1 Tax=Taklimakanibacter albus TaxID=2800327 RepID=A0ACC5RG32_9HYPH|nr:hypothetical protein [Aestuariivirga sp. YIM B02566]MBK1871560.1 hypothetical protein [Aestuariivirga sp. YIM B02566]
MTAGEIDHKTAPTLYVDGDVIAFVAASAVQKTYEDDFGYVWPFANIMEGQVAVDNMLFLLKRRLQSEVMWVYLSDPEANWRMHVEPTYKDNRKTSVRPMLLGRMKQYLRDRYKATHVPGLEADDCLGIAATEDPSAIVVGRDKDFLSFPGRYHKLKDMDGNGKPIITTTTLEQANRMHMIQALAGDRIDGYYGCPGIGPERAARIIDNPVILKPEEGVITRGKNKGQKTTKWVAEPTEDVWACIVSHYRKEGLDEGVALKNARMARILRHGDLADDGKIKLWEPPNALAGGQHVVQA